MPRKKYTSETYPYDRYLQDRKLVDEVESTKTINFSSPSIHLDDKIYVLKEVLGYNYLRVGSNKSETRFLPISKCNASRINNVVRDAYYSAKSRIMNFGDPSKKKPKKTLEFKIEKSGQLRWV